MPWFLVCVLHVKAAELKRMGVLQGLSEWPRLNGITKPDLRLMNVFRHRVICAGFLAGYAYEIVVDDLGCSALPVDIEDN
jgi:hypothetical protein